MKDFFEALAGISGTIHGTFGSPEIFVQVVEHPIFTKNLFGDISEISGKKLRIIESNRDGDCLCLFTGKLGTNIVDVDHRDIVRTPSK